MLRQDRPIKWMATLIILRCISCFFFISSFYRPLFQALSMNFFWLPLQMFSMKGLSALAHNFTSIKIVLVRWKCFGIKKINFCLFNLLCIIPTMAEETGRRGNESERTRLDCWWNRLKAFHHYLTAVCINNKCPKNAWLKIRLSFCFVGRLNNSHLLSLSLSFSHWDRDIGEHHSMCSFLEWPGKINF